MDAYENSSRKPELPETLYFVVDAAIGDQVLSDGFKGIAKVFDSAESALTSRLSGDFSVIEFATADLEDDRLSPGYPGHDMALAKDEGEVGYISGKLPAHILRDATAASMKPAI